MNDFFSYDAYENPGDPIAWRIVRNDAYSLVQNRRLLYMGEDPESTDPAENPFLWEDYTVRTVFSSSVAGSRTQLMARANNVGSHYTDTYMAHWTMSGNSPLIIAKDFISGSGVWGTALATSAVSHAFSTDTLYTLEFTVQGENLTANLYQGTDLDAEGALKLTISTTDSSYSAGSFAIGNRPPNNNNHRIDFWSIEAIPEPGILALFGLGGLALFRLRRRTG